MAQSIRVALGRLIMGLVAGAVVTFPVHAQDQRRLVPEAFTLNEAAANAIKAQFLTDEERAALRVFHGVWDDRDLINPQLKAMVALNAWDFENPALSDPAAPAELRAEAKLLAGELEEAIATIAAARSNHASRIRAEAHEGLGEIDQANEVVNEPVKRLLQTKLADASELTQGVRSMFIRARIQNQPSRDFQSMMSLLGRAHQELDRLYWPAKLAEAELLAEKDNDQEAVVALHETLSLNPRCAQAWYLLGRIALSKFDFDSANTAAEAIRRTNRRHPLAAILLAESRLIQDDPDGAKELLRPILMAQPNLRLALAYDAAADALFYDEAAMKTALDRFDSLSPNSAQAYAIVGRHLALNRQYDLAASALEEAVRRQPGWPSPRIELGLLEMQSGRDDKALQALKSVASMDPFNKRAANSLFLLEELATYEQIESEHFVVRYKPGVDKVLAEMMLDPLERIHSIVAGRFKFEPDRKTVIEVMPDHQRFAVRITGMPFVHTIAACTGPLIAMEVPKDGQPGKHLGVFDWPRVIQHEYTHTITLGQTRNRIPHWLTEGAAVSMEPGPRSYATCRLLADAYSNDTVFRLDELKWAFVRPRLPNDRSKAYAIGHWMVEYMNERFGDDALVTLLGRYFQGEREQQAIPNALKVSRMEFYTGFLEWAGTQVESWGLAAKPSVEELMDELRWADPQMALVMEASRQARLDAIVKHLNEQIGQVGSAEDRELRAERWPPIVRPPVEVSDEQLATWLEKYPDHPDLIERQIRTRLKRVSEEESANDDVLIGLLERYAELRPVDPFPHKKLAQIWTQRGDAAKAIPHFEYLDIREDKTAVYATKLASLYREAGELDKALEKATRAIHINPYHAPSRELAATIALELKQFPVAKQHVGALTLLEPDRPQHAKRLQAIEKLMVQ
jgi:cellulose synthase operon protein C